MTAVVQTDRSGCFETINHDILVKNLYHYDVSDNELKILKKIMNQYVTIDTYNFDLLLYPPCCVIQGLKLSSLLYLLYTNEIPLLKNLMYDSYFII